MINQEKLNGYIKKSSRVGTLTDMLYVPRYVLVQINRYAATSGKWEYSSGYVAQL